jgi:hypothetical protein
MKVSESLVCRRLVSFLSVLPLSNFLFTGDLPSYIFLTGDIVDSGTNYNITGAVIGEFGGKNKQ